MHTQIEEVDGPVVRERFEMFGTRIVILDEALAQTRYFAYFTNNETLDQILSAINSDRKMKISRRDGVVYLSLK